MAKHVLGGMNVINNWRNQKKYLSLIDALLDTHDQVDIYKDLSDSEKEAFRRQQEEFLSVAKLKQYDNESVTKYTERMQKRYDLSVKLLDLIAQTGPTQSKLGLEPSSQTLTERTLTYDFITNASLGDIPVTQDNHTSQHLTNNASIW